MNTAYVPSAFYRRLVCQEGDGTGDYLSSQADDVYNAFLHFEHHDTSSPSTTGTLVRIIPIDDSQSVDSLNQDDDIVESVHLHPLLIKVLIALGRDKEVETDVYHDDDDNSAPNDSHQVLISSWDDDGRGDDAGTLGWLELINPIMNSNRNGSLIPMAIHLTYICSTTSRGRDCFRNKQNNDIMNAGTGNEFLMNLLAGQVVTEGSVIGIDIGEKFDDDDGYYYNNELHREDMVFFMVNKIVTTDGSIINAKYLYLEPGQQFDVLLNADCSNATIDNPQPKTQWNNCKCPGYESILDELLTLTKISNPNGSPTAVILSGCSGVGKSRMVCFLYVAISFHLIR